MDFQLTAEKATALANSGASVEQIVSMIVGEGYEDVANATAVASMLVQQSAPVSSPAEVAVLDAPPISDFRTIALAALARGEGRTLPIAVGGKNPLIKWKDAPIDTTTEAAWAALAPAWIDELAAKYPNANCCVVAKPDEFLFIDEDLSKEFRAAYEQWSGEKFPNTYATSARENRLQSHWKQTDATRRMGNVVQGATFGQMISVRQNNLYVLAEGSQHKNGVDYYKSVGGPDILPMPDKLVEYIQTLRTDRNKETSDFSKKPEGWLDEPFIHGNINNQVASVIGHYISAKNIKDPEELYLLIEARIEKNGCFDKDGVTPYSWNRDEVRKMCQAKVKVWLTGEDKRGTPLKLNMAEQGVNAAPVAAVAVPVAEEPAEVDIKQAEYPVFPSWVMAGTSLYENFIKPICNVDCRIPYFMWMPAMVMLLNYVGPKLRIKGFNTSRLFKGGIYMVIIGRRGKTMKSSSVADVKNYFQYIGCQVPYSRDVRAVEGRALTTTVGSMESLGLQMQGTGAKSAILIYDELETLAKKAGIEGSSMKSHLLTTYEGNTFQNGVKSAKESFSIQPPYCVSLIANTTVKKFPKWWSILTDADSGWDNRFVFILEPQVLPEPSMMQGTQWEPNAPKTKMLIDRAINQGEFAYDDPNSPALMELIKIDNRYAARAEKWAVAFAVDLGRDCIDDECIERAVALVKYEMAVKKYHRVHAAVTKEGQIQQDIRRVLEAQPKARMEKNALLKACKASQYGTTMWSMAYGGLTKYRIIAESGAGVKGDPCFVRVLVPRDVDSEDEDE